LNANRQGYANHTLNHGNILKATPQTIINDTILPGLINGETGSEIAKQAGVSEPTVSRLKTKLSDQIETFQLQLINQSGQDTVDNITKTISRARTVLHDDTIGNKAISDYKDLLNLSHKKEVLIGQSMGILPTHTRSQVIVNIFNETNTIVNPEVLAILHNHESQAAVDVDLGLIDVTPNNGDSMGTGSESDKP
jgi:hypothetical protein